MMEIVRIDEEVRSKVVDFVTSNWGAPIIVSRGKIHSVDELPGFLAFDRGIINALITYHMENKECEIVSLDSLKENHGIGSRLIEYVVREARKQNCKRIWLITTNDNTRAIRFYQKRGFNMIALHVNAVEASRRIKPEIPLYGFDNIPILHEIEFEKRLDKNL